MNRASVGGFVDGDPTYRAASALEVVSVPKPNASDPAEDKPAISFTLTMFNILCSAVGIGVLFLPSTLCGSGLPLGIASILLIGLAADWSSRALVKATCKTKSKSLEEMFQKVLGRPAAHIYSISVFFLLIGALSIYLIMMGMLTFDVYFAMKEQDNEVVKDGTKAAYFRHMALVFSVLCGLSLFIRNLKMLSYVSIIKIVVIILVLLLAASYAPHEYTRRRDTHLGTASEFKDEFPLYPAMLGLMKALGSWQTAYLFHMGVSDMYFSLSNRSYSKWSKVSRLSVLIIAILNVSFAVVGYLATADQLIKTKGATDLCAAGGVFLGYYEAKYNNKVKFVLLMLGRGTIVLILMSSYPLLFYFLKEYTIQIVRNLAPDAVASRSKESVNLVATLTLWVLVTSCSMITNDPFKVTDLVVSVVGTIVVFLMPTLCYIKIHGGFAYVFSLGMCGKVNPVERVPSRSVSGLAQNDLMFAEKEHVESERTSVIGMLSAQSVLYLSFAFMLIGVGITAFQMYNGVDMNWRDSFESYMKRVPEEQLKTAQALAATLAEKIVDLTAKVEEAQK